VCGDNYFMSNDNMYDVRYVRYNSLFDICFILLYKNDSHYLQ